MSIGDVEDDDDDAKDDDAFVATGWWCLRYSCPSVRDILQPVLEANPESGAEKSNQEYDDLIFTINNKVIVRIT